MTKTTAILLLTLLLLSLMTGSILAQSDDGQFYVVRSSKFQKSTCWTAGATPKLWRLPMKWRQTTPVLWRLTILT